MKRALFILMLILTVGVQAVERQKLNFNSGWRLQVGDVAEAEKPEFDDSQWQRVTLPYAFNGDEAFRKDIVDLTDTVCWYRKTFTLTEADVATCDVTKLVDVSIHVASHQVSGTKSKNENYERDQIQKRKLREGLNPKKDGNHEKFKLKTHFSSIFFLTSSFFFIFLLLHLPRFCNHTPKNVFIIHC